MVMTLSETVNKYSILKIIYSPSSVPNAIRLLFIFETNTNTMQPNTNSQLQRVELSWPQ